MIPDRLQYFVDFFWNDQTCDQIWTLGPRTYHQNTSTNTRNIGISLNNIMFHIWDYGFFKSSENPCAEL